MISSERYNTMPTQRNMTEELGFEENLPDYPATLSARGRQGRQQVILCRCARHYSTLPFVRFRLLIPFVPSRDKRPILVTSQERPDAYY